MNYELKKVPNPIIPRLCRFGLKRVLVTTLAFRFESVFLLVDQRKIFLSRGKKWRLLTYSLTHFGHLHFALYIDGKHLISIYYI